MGNSSSSELPLAGVICLAVFGYTALIFIIVFIRYMCVRQGKCQDVECGMCGKEGAPQCSDCCISCSESCGCSAPSVNSCLNNCCPNKKLTCLDILLCQCCLGENNCFTNSSIGSCNSCHCDFSCPQCEAVSCCCIEIKIRQPSMGSFTQQLTKPLPNTPQLNTHRNASLTPAPNVGQEKLFIPSSSHVVRTQVQVNRAFDDSFMECGGSLQSRGIKNSESKQLQNKREKIKVSLEPKDLESGEKFSNVEAKGRKINQKKPLTVTDDKTQHLEENPEKETRPKKKLRKKKVNQINESTKMPKKLVLGENPRPGVQLPPIQSSSVESSTIQSNQKTPKKVTQRNNPIKSSDTEKLKPNIESKET
ncbi:uncharacterized protein LOC133205525 [Saccostrea echinata]|uniref:uncharacterized protein LOC133205525 n=1 Tax=Saccostrea echinata TaxID=191078 RepID=UPI002A80941A|nr:uncharacterized protein LOC133205525 [Saccostrea echinata]